ncbi:TIGR03747 family integrating conjugative element membrane protein [Sedimenticola selenatireducens]|uniref:TIGR03747 family integrating conjugative element membrane protein n=1 Tax=Sedimenticola selenatireducens TaxID=191960 RepID=UPI0004B72FA8|nr:TIGR03747 family integrating conjugative element membrane protein [Sedimenticola selenatireducens]
MAETVTDPRRRVVQEGLIAKSLGALARIIQWLLLSLLFSIIIEWAGMLLWWPDEGLEHSRAMLSREIGYLDTDFRRSVITSDPARFAKRVADNTYHYLFEVTRFVDLIHWVTPAPLQGETGLRPTLHKYYRPTAEFVIAMMQITQLFSVRLAILILAMPVFLLFSLLALVDGLVQRDLRRWGGGRESSFVYHYAKKAALPLVVLAWVTYLALPFSLHPTFVVLPFATLFALSVAVTASTFKKYL